MGFFAAIDALKLEVEGAGEKKGGGGGGGEEEKMSWLVSAQLWSDGNRSSSRKSKVAAAAAATEMKQVGWSDQNLLQKCNLFLISSGLSSESSSACHCRWPGMELSLRSRSALLFLLWRGSCRCR